MNHRCRCVRQLAAVVNRIRRTSEGQGLAEYALILALIAIVAIVALIFMGSQVSDKLSVIGSKLESVDQLIALRHRERPVPRTGRSVVDTSAPVTYLANRPCAMRDFLPNLPNGPSPLV